MCLTPIVFFDHSNCVVLWSTCYVPDVVLGGVCCKDIAVWSLLFLSKTHPLFELTRKGLRKALASHVHVVEYLFRI